MGANGVPVKIGLSFGARSLSILRVAVDGVIVTAVKLPADSVSDKDPPEFEVTLRELAEGGVTVTVLTVCVTVAVSFAIKQSLVLYQKLI